MSEKITIALIEHAIRPAVYFVLGLAFVFWLFAVKEPLFQVIGGGETTIRAGDFELSLRAQADAGNLSGELTALQTLNDAQLQLFLVIGKKGKPIEYHGEEIAEENLKQLKAVGLIADYRKKEDEKKENSFEWKVSEKGFRLHDIIFNQVVKSIKRAPAA